MTRDTAVELKQAAAQLAVYEAAAKNQGLSFSTESPDSLDIVLPALDDSAAAAALRAAGLIRAVAVPKEEEDVGPDRGLTSLPRRLTSWGFHKRDTPTASGQAVYNHSGHTGQQRSHVLQRLQEVCMSAKLGKLSISTPVAAHSISGQYIPVLHSSFCS